MKKFSNGGAVMFKTAMFLCVCAIMVCGCGPNEVYVDGTMPTEQTGPTIVIEESTCTSNGDCKADQLCVVDLAASEIAKHTIMVCVLGCDAELVTTNNSDGTSTTAKVPGTDTCQRFGDLTVFCDVGTHLCKAYEPEPVKPDEPTPPVEVKLSTLKCCYAGDLSGLYGQMAYSTATVEEPEAWKALRDLQLGTDGCFGAEADLDTVTKGFWVDLTQGPADGKAAEDVVWKGSSMQPTKCYVGDTEAKIGDFQTNFGWPFGDAAK